MALRKTTLGAQQRSRVKKLHAKGAKVYLCKGLERLGSYHAKEVVVDRRVLYTGSANLTTNSRSNRERVYKMTGRVVQEALLDLRDDRAASFLFDGVHF